MSAQTQLQPRHHGNVFIYIDNSNLWIQGQRTAEEKTFDVKINLYGSTPPPVDTVWKAIESHNVNVTTFKRSSWNQREKQVDAELIARSSTQAVKAYYQGVPAVFIIVSGDRDVRSAVMAITEQRYRVHLWSWNNGLAKIFREHDDEIAQGLFEVHLLDDYLEEVGFHASTFRIDRAVIDPHSIVVLDPLPRGDNVEAFLNHLRTPVYRYEIKPNRADASSPDLAIIPAHAVSMTSNELRDLFVRSKTDLEKRGLTVLSYLDYSQIYLEGSTVDKSLALSSRFHEFPSDPGEDDSDNSEADDDEDQTLDNGNNINHQGAFGGQRRNFETPGASNGDGIQRGPGNDNQHQAFGEDDNDGFIDVNRGLIRQRNRLRQKEERLLTRCYWRTYCERGLNCDYGHTKEEEERFRVYGNRKAKKTGQDGIRAILTMATGIAVGKRLSSGH
ncbi:hypothetical protein B0J18DRAFT_488683 [Chaetomium sp. MPI-SDFR-AT-0129]|nr:hypothetical protein B0J18DRAFT_488683 [Chaetomium sp. MPI-SDFR-AT-0129]